MAYHTYELAWGIKPDANVPGFLKKLYSVNFPESDVVQKMAYNSIKVSFKPNNRLIEPLKISLNILSYNNYIILENSFTTNLQ